jgi:hypothetical protein
VAPVGPVTPVTTAARAPYTVPPAPRPEERRTPSAGVARLQRSALLGGLFTTVAVGFARAPYLSLIALCLVTLAVRTASWTTESADERTRLRGRRRWYDAPMTLLSVPWYLVVATAGTLLLLLWSGMVAFVVGFAYLLFGAPLVPGLLVMGGVLATSLWWGPGSRRVRVPTRRLLHGLTRRTWAGWLGVAVVAAAAVLGAYSLAQGGVLWEPSVGAPWRPGTILGDVLHWL